MSSNNNNNNNNRRRSEGIVGSSVQLLPAASTSGPPPPAARSASLPGSSNSIEEADEISNSIRATTPDHVVIRSLRRRLWDAFVREDLDCALQCYKATRADWEQWRIQEIKCQEEELQQQRRRHQKKKKNLRAGLMLFKKSHSLSPKKFLSSSRRNNTSPKQHTTTKTTSSSSSLRDLVESAKSSVPELLVPTVEEGTTTTTTGDTSPNYTTTMSGPPGHATASSSLGALGILELEIAPTDPFVPDDYKAPQDPYEEEKDDDGGGDDEEELPPPPRALKPKRSSRLMMMGARGMSVRQAFSMFGGSGGRRSRREIQFGTPIESTETADDNNNDNWEDQYFTTPLHEAARLGHAELVRIMLANPQADCNVRNGYGRTVLHCAVGGLTAAEAVQLPYKAKKISAAANDGKYDEQEDNGMENIGIRAPCVPPSKEESLKKDAGGKNGKSTAASMMKAKVRRILGDRRHHPQHNNADENRSFEKITTTSPETLAGQGPDQLKLERMKVVAAILAWSQPARANGGDADGGEDDHPTSASMGISTNAVDGILNRTALHYAAELGRADICNAVLDSFFATMLTVIDCTGRTPCELAGACGFDDLAAYLEARALLYIDPFGSDEELLGVITANEHSRTGCVAPFSWFETLSPAELRQKRENRVFQATTKMKQIAEKLRTRQETRNAVQEYAKHNRLESDDSGGPDRKAGSLSPAAFGTFSSDGETNQEFFDVPSFADTDNAPSASGSSDNVDIKAPSPSVEDADNVCGALKTPDNDNDVTAQLPSSAEDADNVCGALKTPDNDSGVTAQLPCSAEDADDVCGALKSPDNDNDATAQLPSSTDDVDNVCGALEISDSVDDVKAPPSSADDADNLPHTLGPSDNGDDGAFISTPWPSGNNDDERDATGLDDVDDTPNALRPSNSDDRDFSIFENLLHEFHVELFLTFHKWDVPSALLAFYEDPYASFEEAKVPFPSKASRDSPETQTAQCLICCEVFESNSSEWRRLDGCLHSFCTSCLGDYLEESAKTKSIAVPCPHHECTCLLTPSEINELAPSVEVREMLRANTDESFVVSAEDLRFCPHPGCGAAVKLNGPKSKSSDKREMDHYRLAGAVCTNVGSDSNLSPNAVDCEAAVTYEGVHDPNYYDPFSEVQPKKPHRFCFQCGELFNHWPITCDRFREWKEAVQEQVSEVEMDGEVADVKGDYIEIAHRLWIKANTRPCPKCEAPIQKNEGCNHMTCSNPHCKHEFCWICRKDWKLHNTETGGFFRCNRWVEEKDHDYYDSEEPDASHTFVPLTPEDMTDPRTMESTYGTAMHESRAARKRSKEMARFLHHYERWNAHQDSADLEHRMEATVCSRLAPVVREAIAFNGNEYIFCGKGLSFVHDAFSELLECRSLLRYSYAFSFFRYKFDGAMKYRMLKQRAREKMVFEQLQSELEMMTEQISDVVARSHIRATQNQITFLTAAASDKRREFSSHLLDFLRQEQKDEEEVNRKKKEENRRNDDGTAADPPGSILASVSATAYAFEPVTGSYEENTDAAVQESLREFIASSGVLDYTSDDEDMDWPCSACTFVNSGGRRCDMCGNPRN